MTHDRENTRRTASTALESDSKAGKSDKLVQLKRSLVEMKYEDQVEALRPSAPVQLKGAVQFETAENGDAVEGGESTANEGPSGEADGFGIVAEQTKKPSERMEQACDDYILLRKELEKRGGYESKTEKKKAQQYEDEIISAWEEIHPIGSELVKLAKSSDQYEKLDAIATWFKNIRTKLWALKGNFGHEGELTDRDRLGKLRGQVVSLANKFKAALKANTGYQKWAK